MPNVWGRFERITHGIPRLRHDRSVADYLKHRRRPLPASDRQLLVSLVEGFDAAPIEIASANAISTAGQPRPDADDKAQWKVENGYFEIVPKTGSIRTREKVAGDSPAPAPAPVTSDVLSD